MELDEPNLNPNPVAGEIRGHRAHVLGTQNGSELENLRYVNEFPIRNAYSFQKRPVG